MVAPETRYARSGDLRIALRRPFAPAPAKFQQGDPANRASGDATGHPELEPPPSWPAGDGGPCAPVGLWVGRGASEFVVMCLRCELPFVSCLSA